MKILLICLMLSAVIILAGCSTLADKSVTDFKTADLHCMIYDYHGQPCSNVRIRLDNKEGPRSDINGRFTLKNLAKGPHQIVLSKDTYEEISFSFDFTNRTQVLYLKLCSMTQLLELAEKELDNKKLARAEALLNRAAKIDADNAVLLYLKAILALKRDQVGEAIANLKKILDQGVIESMVLLTLADIYQYHHKDLEQAVYFLKRYVLLEEDIEAQKRLKALEQELAKHPPASESPPPSEPVKKVAPPPESPPPEAPEKDNSASESLPPSEVLPPEAPENGNSPSEIQPPEAEENPNPASESLPPSETP
jgi:tetratricopeptide (TPR) repeat protein